MLQGLNPPQADKNQVTVKTLLKVLLFSMVIF